MAEVGAQVGGAGVGGSGVVTRALLAIAGDAGDERALAEQICRACVAGLDIDGASISLLTASDVRETLWASDATAEQLEDLQFALGEGVCVEAATTGRPVLVPDVRDDLETSRWPVFAAAVAEQSAARALFGLPLQWGTVNLGVLDLYRRAAGSLHPAQLRDVMAVADIAAVLLLGLRTDPAGVGSAGGGSVAGGGIEGGAGAGGGGEGVEWLNLAVSGRAEIHQATGMVLAQLGVPATDALARLRAYAFAEQRLLGDVAHDVVSRRLWFTPDSP